MDRTKNIICAIETTLGRIPIGAKPGDCNNQIIINGKIIELYGIECQDINQIYFFGIEPGASLVIYTDNKSYIARIGFAKNRHFIDILFEN